MIELTEEQRQSLQDGHAVRVRENGREYVMVRPELFERLVDADHDDGPWTADETDMLRDESLSLLDRFGKDS